MEPCGPPDIISDLPNNIIEHILMRLPISDAVGTSILSRKWRYKWVTLPHLVIDSSLGKQFLGRRESGKYELVKVVYRLLLLHKGPIVKFALEVDELESCPDIDCWINFLSNQDIQEFTLSRTKTDQYKLPSYLFTFQHLKHLKLRCCAFRPPPGFKGFSELKILELEEVIIDAETFCSLVSNCQLLEKLFIANYTTYDSLEISAPNLISLSLTGEFGSLSFKNTRFLERVAVDLRLLNRNVKHESSNLVKFICSLPAVQKLYLDGYFMEYLSLGNAPKILSVHLDYLTVLDIYGMDFSCLDEVSCALHLITCCPNLQHLIIMAHVGDSAKDAVVNYFETQNLPCCSLKRVRMVRMEQISNFEPELEFIKFILANSPELEEMEVVQSKDTVGEDERNMWKKVMRFRRASPKAEIIM